MFHLDYFSKENVKIFQGAFLQDKSLFCYLEMPLNKNKRKSQQHILGEITLGTSSKIFHQFYYQLYAAV